MCFSLKRELCIHLLCSLLVMFFSQPSWAAANSKQVILASTGDNVTFICDGLPVDKTFSNSSAQAVRWEMKRTIKKEEFTPFFVNGRYFETETNCTGCEVNTSTYNNETGSVDTNFTINNVDESHAGRFRCSFVWDQKATGKDYELEVLASVPSCRINESSDSSKQLIHVNEYDVVTVVCDAQYAGNWRPVFYCQPEIVQSFSININFSSDGIVEYVSTVNVTSSFNQRSITCNMNFTRNTLSSADSSTFDHPDFEWTLPVMDVTYSFKGGNITRDDTILNCRVDSNPEPTIQWVYYISDNSINNSSETNNSDIYVPIAISNVSMMDICNVYNDSLFTQPNETESYNISFECTAEFNERIVVGKIEFYLDKFEDLFGNKCERTHSLDENIKEVTTTGENEAAGESEVSTKQMAANTQTLLGSSTTTPQIIALSLQTILALVLPLVGILLISFIIITVLICQVRSRRRLSTKKKRKESSAKKSVSFGERISGAYDDIYDIPEETAAARHERQIGDANDGYNNLYDETREPPSSSAGYDSIETPPSEPTSTTNQTVNNSRQPGTTHPYLSVVADDDIVEYASSKTYYEDGHLTRAHTHVQTNHYNKPDANTTDYLIPTVSSGYTSINSSFKPNDTALIGEVTPCQADEAPTYAVINKKGYQKLEPSTRKPDRPTDIKKEYVPLRSSPTPEEVRDLTPLDAQPILDNTKGYYNLNPATAADKPPAPSSTMTPTAEADSAQVYNQTEQSQGYNKLDPATLADSLLAAKTYLPLDPSASRAEIENAQISSNLNVSNGYCTVGATAVKDVTGSTTKDYVPLLPSSQSSSTEIIDEQSNDYRKTSNNGYHKLDPHSLQFMSDKLIHGNDYSSLMSSTNNP